MKPYQHGLIVGQFVPPHNGHLALIDIAQSLSSTVTILVLDKTRRWCSAEQSATWLRDILPQTVRIETTPTRNTADIAQWLAQHDIIADVVFGANNFTMQLAHKLGIKPHHMDQSYQMISAKSSDIQKDPQTHWHQIPNAIRQDFRKRICFLGPESVGKTTMARMVAQTLNTVWCPEYGRIYTENFKAHDDPWCADELIEIAAGHIAYRHAASRHAGTILIEDTDILQTIVFAQYLINTIPEALRNYAQDYPLADHYYLLNPDVSWQDDGVRYTGDPKIRMWFFNELQNLLEQYHCSYHVITGNEWNARIDAVQNDIKTRITAI